MRLWISKFEDYTEDVIRKTKKVLPTIGRVLLVSTFLEDGFRLMFNLSIHADHFASIWWGGYAFFYCVTLIMAILLLVVPVLVLARFKVTELCGVLAVVLFVEIVLYELLTTYRLLIRNFSIFAALLLLVMENMLRKPKQYDQLPRDENEVDMTSVILCGCRLFLNLILVSLVKIEFSFSRLIVSFISYGLMIFVWCGYKTRAMSFVLAIWLFVFNMFTNDFWNRETRSDTVRYDFFQTLSAVGGLLLLMHTGPGDLSVDEFKKKW
uniref:Surfeit locus protein 4 homolog n=1 Tax=Caenorhabditis japonica TaxID=281687 RepID=A0A8R1HNR3_CAEJA